MKISVTPLKSHSASITKSLRGTIAMIAKSKIKVEDDDHESNIKRGEKFYLKKLGQRHYLLDVEGKDLYQFGIDKKLYDQLMSKHTREDVAKQKAAKKKGGSNVTDLSKIKGTKGKKPSASKETPAAKDKAVVSAAGVLRERQALEKDKNVKAYLKLKKTEEHLKEANNWLDPDKKQISQEAQEVKAKLSDAMQNQKVNKYIDNQKKGTANDIMGEALNGKDPEYTKQKQLFDKGSAKGSRRSMMPALKKMQAIIAKYTKALL